MSQNSFISSQQLAFIEDMIKDKYKDDERFIVINDEWVIDREDPELCFLHTVPHDGRRDFYEWSFIDQTRCYNTSCNKPIPKNAIIIAKLLFL